ncbi:MAG TPA: PilZ domain-containing protein [Xanthomonadales bacterium]|nr:PilZ domain-containing protein [Xanthomonadales bacterium]
MVQGYEKRRHPRTEISAVAVLVATARGGFLSNALDISGGGARVALPLTWKDSSAPPFRLFFIFDQDTVVDVRATLVRAGDNHLAFQFDAGQPDEIDQLLYETRFIVQEV